MHRESRVGINLVKLLCYLNGYQKNCFESEFASTGVEEIFEAGSEQLHDEGVVLAAHTEVVNVRHPFSTTQLFVKPEKFKE